MKIRLKKFKHGFSLAEMLIYAALVSIIGYILIVFVFNISLAFNKSRIKKEVLASARTSMEIMLQDIRSSNSVYTPSSLFDQPLGHLSLYTNVNPPEGETYTYIDYFVSSSRLWVKQEGRTAVALTPPNMAVERLYFHRFYDASSSAEAVQVEIMISYYAVGKQELDSSSTILSTATLRSAYER